MPLRTPIFAVALAAALGAQAPEPQTLGGPMGWQSFFDVAETLMTFAGSQVPEWMVHSAPIRYAARCPLYDEAGHPLLDAQGRPRCATTLQSGRVFFPPTWRVPFHRELPLVLYTHATVVMKQAVPSVFGGYEWFLGAAAATWYGMAVAMPDLPGLGLDAGTLHPFCHGASLAYAAVDSLPAVTALTASDPFLAANGYHLNGQLMVLGYSEGGYAALATVRELERHPEAGAGLRLTASACMAGPFDLSGTTRDDLLHLREPFAHPFFIPYVILAYHARYGAALDPREVLAATLLEQRPDGDVTTWFDGRLEGPVVDALILGRQGDAGGTLMRGLLSPRWVAGTLDDPAYAASTLRRLLEENDLWRDWVPTRPILFAHCPDDTDIPVRHTLVTVDHLAAQTRAAGGVPERLLFTRFLSTRGSGVGHAGGLLRALPLALQWFHDGTAEPALLPPPAPPPALERLWCYDPAQGGPAPPGTGQP